MAINKVFLISLILGSPIYIVLQAALLVIPPYGVLLAIALGAAYLLLRSPSGVGGDEILTFLVLLIGLSCALGGLAVAPLLIQMAIGISCLAFHQRYASIRS